MNKFYIVKVNNTLIPIQIVKKKKINKITIKPDPLKGQIVVSTPRFSTYNFAMSFVKKNIDWVHDVFYEHKKQNSITGLKTITLIDKEYNVNCQESEKNKIKITENAIDIWYQNIEKGQNMFFNKIKNFAKEEIIKVVDEFCKELGVEYNRISIKDTNSRWGSCSKEKNLNFSWRIILAPRFAFLSVCAHEVCHLVHMNHSKEFWECLEKLYPNYKEGHKFMKENANAIKTLI